MKFIATLSFLPFVLGTGEERIRFGRSMHKRSRKLTAISSDNGQPDFTVVSDNRLGSTVGDDATTDIIVTTVKTPVMFTHNEQRQLKSSMFSDRLLHSSNDVLDDSMSLKFIEMSYSMAMSVGFLSMSPVDNDFTSATTITPPTESSSSTSATAVSTGTPSPNITTEKPSTVALMTTAPTPVPTESVSDQHFGNMIFEYLSQCADLNLDTDSCLVDETIDEFMRVYATEEGGVNRRRRLGTLSDHGRFLQASETNEDACGRPDVPEQDMRTIMSVAKTQCENSGTVVSDVAFDSTLDTFLQLFASKGCWVSLCSGSDDSTKLLFEILLEDASVCAGVQLDANECVMDHIIELLVNGEDVITTSVSRSFHRTLQQVADSDLCERPNEDELNLLVSYLLTDAEAKCSGLGIDLNSTDWYTLSSNLVTIFSSPTCWGVNGCDDEQVATVATNSTTTNAPEEEETIDIQLSADTSGQSEKDYTAAVIGAIGGAVALVLFAAGIRNWNKGKTNVDDSVHLPDDKSDDDSNDGQSTAYNTADLTYVTSGNDRIDVSPLPSPASYRSDVPPILPALDQDDGSLNTSDEVLFIDANVSGNGELPV